MTRIIIFGGTSEGRDLAEWSDKNGFQVILCVATDYGETVCPPGEHLTIRKGRMDRDEMSAFLKNECPQIVIDATHPHAAEVSENIIKAAKEQGLPLIRVVRPAPEHSGNDKYCEWEKDSVFYVSSAVEALDYLDRDDKPILLTTGSKEIREFSGITGFAWRVYARVLPQSAAISACEMAGLSGPHIIAMQGPFSTEMNVALINSVKAGWLVTKESGESGGFNEKMEAAAKCGIRAIVIRRPFKEDGYSLNETKKALLKLKGSSADPCCITLAGLGMGGGSQLTLEALRAIESSQAVFGARRMLDDVSLYANGIPLVELYKCEDILSYLEQHPDIKKACVIFSGDTGFYSGCSDFVKMAAPLKTEKNNTSGGVDTPIIHILPGISSFSCLCARFGLSEEGFTPASAHGKHLDIINLLKDKKKIFLILDPETTIGAVCRAVTAAGLGDTKVYAGVRLGYTDEGLFSGKAEDLTELKADALAVMALEMMEKSNA